MYRAEHYLRRADWLFCERNNISNERVVRPGYFELKSLHRQEPGGDQTLFRRLQGGRHRHAEQVHQGHGPGDQDL